MMHEFSRMLLLAGVALSVAGSIVNGKDECICGDGPLESDPVCFDSVDAFITKGQHSKGILQGNCPFLTVAVPTPSGSETVLTSDVEIVGAGANYQVIINTPYVTIFGCHFLEFTNVTLWKEDDEAMFVIRPSENCNFNLPRAPGLSFSGSGVHTITNVVISGHATSLFISVENMVFDGRSRFVINGPYGKYYCKRCWFKTGVAAREVSFIHMGHRTTGSYVEISGDFGSETANDTSATAPLINCPYISGYACARQIKMTAFRHVSSIDGGVDAYLIDMDACGWAHKYVPEITLNGIEISTSQNRFSPPTLANGLFRFGGNQFGPEVMIISNPVISGEVAEGLSSWLDGKIFFFDVKLDGPHSSSRGTFGFSVTRNKEDISFPSLLSNYWLATFSCVSDRGGQRLVKAFNVRTDSRIQKQVVVGCQPIYVENEDINARVAYPFEMLEPLVARAQKYMWNVWNKNKPTSSQARFYNRQRLSQNSWNDLQDAIEGAKRLLKLAQVTSSTQPRTLIISGRARGSVASFTNGSEWQKRALRYMDSMTFKDVISPDRIQALSSKPKTEECKLALEESLQKIGQSRPGETFCVENYLNQSVPFYSYNGRNVRGKIVGECHVFISVDPLKEVTDDEASRPQPLFYEPNNLQSHNLAILYSPGHHSRSDTSVAH